MSRVIVVTDLGTKILGMPRRLDEQKSAIENGGYDADKNKLRVRKVRPDRADRIVGKHECKNRQGSKHGEIHAGARCLKLLFVVSYPAPNDAQADQAVTDDHDDGKNGVASEGWRATGCQHDRFDQGHLDDSDGQRQNQRSIWLAHPMRDYVGMMDGGKHCSEHDDDHHHRHHDRIRRGRLHAGIVANEWRGKNEYDREDRERDRRYWGA